MYSVCPRFDTEDGVCTDHARSGRFLSDKDPHQRLFLDIEGARIRKLAVDVVPHRIS